MDHVVYLDKKAKELEKLENGTKSIIIRGATGRKLPYGRVEVEDCLYFILNDGSGIIQAKANVSEVLNSEKMDKDTSIALVDKYADKLDLSTQQYKKWAGKRYLVLIHVDEFKSVDPFKIDRSDYGNMDDWLPVEDIVRVRI